MKRHHILWAIAFAVLVTGTLIGVQMGGRGEEPAPEIPSVDYGAFTTAGMAIGRRDAPVLVEEYFDFQCPHCHDAASQIATPLIDTYVRSGEVRFAYRFFPILGDESILAARGSYCAAKEGGFWPYQQVLFAQRGTGNRGTYDADHLTTYARDVGLETAAFQQCLSGEESLTYVEGSYQKAIQLGLHGTPSYLINGSLVSVSSWDSLKKAIDAALDNGGAE